MRVVLYPGRAQPKSDETHLVDQSVVPDERKVADVCFETIGTWKSLDIDLNSED